MTSICTCGHSKTDHLTGRCVNRTMRFDAASGGTVANRCGCKKLNVAAVTSAVPAVEEAAATEPTTESDETASAELATVPAPSTKTTSATWRKKK